MKEEEKYNRTIVVRITNEQRGQIKTVQDIEEMSMADAVRFLLNIGYEKFFNTFCV